MSEQPPPPVLPPQLSSGGGRQVELLSSPRPASDSPQPSQRFPSLLLSYARRNFVSAVFLEPTAQPFVLFLTALAHWRMSVPRRPALFRVALCKKQNCLRRS